MPWSELVARFKEELLKLQVAPPRGEEHLNNALHSLEQATRSLKVYKLQYVRLLNENSSLKKRNVELKNTVETLLRKIPEE